MFSNNKKISSPLIRGLLIISGIISLTLGIIGIFLPLLPTTPFLLLSAWLFVRSSDKLYQKLLHHKYLGVYIKNYTEHKSIPLKVKIYSISLLWITISSSAFFFVNNWYIRILLLIIAVGVTLHISRFKTMR